MTPEKLLELAERADEQEFNKACTTQDIAELCQRVIEWESGK